MFQKGTGERFKYKEEVQKIRPAARCRKYTYELGSSYISCFLVKDGINEISSRKNTAEDAWADAYYKLQPQQ